MSGNRARRRTSSYLKSFNYKFYELARTLKIAAPVDCIDQDEERPVSVVSSAFQETSARSLLVLLCKDGSLLLLLSEGASKPVIKQFKWFQNPVKKISCFAIDPLQAAWVVCACYDSSIYLIPTLAYLKDPSEVLNPPQKWSLTDLTKVGPFKFTGMPTGLVWWHTIDDRNVCIVGTELGELIFIDLALLQEVTHSSIRERIAKLELIQDIIERVSSLLIHTTTDSTWQLLLESPSLQSSGFQSPTNLSVAFSMGYDTVSDCTMDSILANDGSGNREDLQPNKIKATSQDMNISVQKSKERVFIVRHSMKYQIIEVFSDLDRMPEFTYQLPNHSFTFLLTNQLIFATTRRSGKVTLSVVSKRFASTAMGSDSGKRHDDYSAEVQAFTIPANEDVLAIYAARFHRPPEWEPPFPNNTELKDLAALSKCIIVTSEGVLEARPRIAPEDYFCELSVSVDFGIAEALGMTADLNISLLCQCLAERELRKSNIQAATKFYMFADVLPSQRASDLLQYASVTDSLIFIRQVLKQQRSISFKEKKKLANLAITCYIHQILEKRKGGNFRKTIEDSFRLFLRDNFDYDEKAAMDLLISHSMIDELFEVAKARGVIEDALNLMSERGIFLLSASVRHLLIDRGYAETLCKLKNGVFLDHMSAEEAIKFLIMKPDITKSFLQRINLLLSNLVENSLVQVARIFDPSRALIKPYIERAEFLAKKRSPSLLSLTSLSSTSSHVDDANLPNCQELMNTFLKILVILNAKRFPEGVLPDIKQNIKYLSGQHSWSSIQHRQGSLRSVDSFSGVEISKLACGRNHIAFISQEGDLYTWGRATHGRLGHGDIIEERGTVFPFCVEGLHMHGIRVISVSCGAAHTVVVCKEGVYSWGLNNFGQLGLGDTRKRSRPCQISALTSHGILTTECGHYHTLAICSNNMVWSWGWGIHGQLGYASAENARTPCRVLVPTDERAIQVAAGYAHSAVLTLTGHVYTFGAGFYGQLGIGGNQKKSRPCLVKYLMDESIYLIACGPFETVAVSEEQVIFVWGRSQKQYHICSKVDSPQYGRQLASSLSADITHHFYPLPMPYQLTEPIEKICCGNWHYIAETTAGQVYTWGCNDCGQLGHYNKIDQSTPRLVKALNKRIITAVATGAEFSIAVDSDGNVLAWGRADGGQLGLDGSVCNECTPSGNRKVPVAILSPTQVPGLPSTVEEASLASARSSSRRDTFIERDSEFPDFSTVGRTSSPYSPESLLVALQRLYGSYSHHYLTRLMTDMKQWFPASFCLLLQQQWEQAFLFQVKALETFYKSMKDKHAFAIDLGLLLDDILGKVEDFISDIVHDSNESVEITAFLAQVLIIWTNKKLPFTDLEEKFTKRLDALSPYLTLILFRNFLIAEGHVPADFNIILDNPALQNISTHSFSLPFLVNFTTTAMEQLANSQTNFLFLFGDWNETPSGVITTDVPESSTEVNLSEILEQHLKRLYAEASIYLSSATAATLSAASTAAKTSPLEPWLSPSRDFSSNTSGEPDSIVFSCSHIFPLYYMTDVILPEFQTRMSDLPKPLPLLAGILLTEYKVQKHMIRVACPCCVYNNLRQEQMQLLQGSSNEFNVPRSTYWEI